MLIDTHRRRKRREKGREREGVGGERGRAGGYERVGDIQRGGAEKLLQ